MLPDRRAEKISTVTDDDGYTKTYIRIDEWCNIIN